MVSLDPRLLVALLLVASPLAGCVGQPSSPEGTDPRGVPTPPPGPPTDLPVAGLDAPVPRHVETRRLHTWNVTVPTVAPTWQPIQDPWDVELPPTILAISGTLSWSEPENKFGLEIRPEHGENRTVHPDRAGSAGQSFQPSRLPAGNVTFQLLAEGPVLRDRIRLTLWLVRAPPDWIRTERVNGSWSASAAVRDVAPALDGMGIDVDTSAGDVFQRARADLVHAEVNKHAAATERWQAREAVKGVHHFLQVADDRVRVEARPNGSARADVRWLAPTRTTFEGSVRTGAGDVQLDAIRTVNLTVVSAEGNVNARVWSGGPVHIRAPDGRAVLNLTPLSDVQVDVRSGSVAALELPNGTGLDLHVASDALEVGLHGARRERTDDGWRIVRPSTNALSVQGTVRSARVVLVPSL